MGQRQSNNQFSQIWDRLFEAPKRLAELMYNFCPDIVAQGCGLVESLASSDRLFFWWD